MQFLEHRPDPELGYWERVADASGPPYFINRRQNRSEWEIPPGEERRYLGAGNSVDPYNNIMFMSLKEFADHEDASELIHNGQTLQVSHHL